MRILIVTSEWPTADNSTAGIHIFNQVECLRQAGLDVEVFSFRGKANPLLYALAIVRLRRVYRTKPVDVIHAHHGQAGLVALAHWKRPFVVTFHGSDLQGVVSRTGRYTMTGHVLRILSRFVGLLADEVVVVSEHMIRGLPRRPSHVIPTGVDLQLFYPMPQIGARNTLGLPIGQRLVLFGGNPENPIKRYELARHAVEQLDRSLDTKLIIANGISHNLMPLYMNACDTLLVTSLHEGSPRAVREALACNLPVVSVDVGDIRQRIGHVEGCVLCPDDLVSSITAGLARVLEDRRRVDGLQEVIHLDERLLVQKVIKVYESALENHT